MMARSRNVLLKTQRKIITYIARLRQQCHNTTVSQHNSVKTQQCHNKTVSQQNSVTTQQCHNTTVSQHNSVTTQVSQHNSVITKQCHNSKCVIFQDRLLKVSKVL